LIAFDLKMMREQCARSVLSDLLMVLVCLLTYVIDLIVSAFLVAKYLKNSNEVIAILVTVLLLLPGVMTSILSCCWLLKDPPYRKMLPNRFHVVRTLSIIFLVSPLSGYINSLYFLLQRYQTRSNGEVAALQRVTDAMVGCVCEVTLLRLFQSVLSTTPSSVLEFYLLLKHNHRLEGMLEKVGVVTALISISVSLTAYTGTFRRSRQYEGMNPFYIDAVLFLINLFNISARVLAISLFATISWQYTGVVCAIHWLVMTLWLLLPISKSTFRVDKLLDSFVLATAYIFVFIHDENNRTLYKYLFYYTVT